MTVMTMTVMYDDRDEVIRFRVLEVIRFLDSRVPGRLSRVWAGKIRLAS